MPDVRLGRAFNLTKGIVMNLVISPLKTPIQMAAEGANVGGVPCGVLWAVIAIYAGN